MLFARHYDSSLPGCSGRSIHDGSILIGHLWFGPTSGMHEISFSDNAQGYAETAAAQALAVQISEAGGGVTGFLSVWESLPRDDRQTDWPERLPVELVPSVR